MNRLEVARLLAKIQLGDRRQVTDLVIDDWFETIGHLDYPDAYQAVVNHRRTSTEYLMPAHITRAIHSARPQTAVTMSPEAPTSCPGGVHRWLPDGTCVHCTERKHHDPV